MPGPQGALHFSIERREEGIPITVHWHGNFNEKTARLYGTLTWIR